MRLTRMLEDALDGFTDESLVRDVEENVVGEESGEAEGHLESVVRPRADPTRRPEEEEEEGSSARRSSASRSKAAFNASTDRDLFNCNGEEIYGCCCCCCCCCCCLLLFSCFLLLLLLLLLLCLVVVVVVVIVVVTLLSVSYYASQVQCLTW